MSLRSVILGFLVAAVLCAVVYFNDAVLVQTMCIGNHIPMTVFGGLLATVLFLNPLLGWLGRRFATPPWLHPLSARELCMILALVLPVCCVPYSSLFRMLPRGVMLPHHFAKIDPSWKLSDDDGKTFYPATVLLPKRMLANADYDDGNALLAFVQGMKSPDGSAHISLSDIPWEAWREPLTFWLTSFVLLWLVLGGIAVAVHRQWTENEHLPYPIVQFTRAMLPTDGARIGPIFRNKLFWGAFLIVFAVHINNYLCVYWSDFMIPVVRNINIYPFSKLMPTFMRGGGGSLLTIRIFYTAVAIAYLVQTDVSLAIGWGPFIFCLVGGILTKYGYPVADGTLLAPHILNGWVLGGFVGFFCMMAYTGRHYYWGAIKAAAGCRIHPDVPISAAWGLRLSAVAFVAFVLNLAIVGLDWPLALMYSVLIVMLLVVLGRIIAETGAFHLCPGLYACSVFIGFMGEQALGPAMMLTMGMVTCIMMHDVRESFMPFMVNALEITRVGKLPAKRTLGLTALAIVMGLCIACPVTLFWAYDRGVDWRDGTSTVLVPRQAFLHTLPARHRLQAQGTLERSMTVKGLARFALVKPKPRYVVAFLSTFFGVMLFSSARLRFTWWPLHPVMFCLWPHYPGRMMAWSFVIGGTLKVLVTHYGGVKCHQMLKPAMFGLIAGDMLAGLAVIISGAIYYFATGTLPKTYWVLPG